MDLRSRPDAVGGGRAGGRGAETSGCLAGATNRFKSVTQLFRPRVKFCYRAKKTVLNDILLLGNINFRGRHQTATGAFGGRVLLWIYGSGLFSFPPSFSGPIHTVLIQSTMQTSPRPHPQPHPRQHIAAKYVRAQIPTR